MVDDAEELTAVVLVLLKKPSLVLLVYCCTTTFFLKAYICSDSSCLNLELYFSCCWVNAESSYLMTKT